MKIAIIFLAIFCVVLLALLKIAFVTIDKQKRTLTREREEWKREMRILQHQAEFSERTTKIVTQTNEMLRRSIDGQWSEEDKKIWRGIRGIVRCKAWNTRDEMSDPEYYMRMVRFLDEFLPKEL